MSNIVQLKEQTMLTELKATLSRCAGTLVQDAAGVAALVAMLVVGLNLPMFY